MSILQIAIPTPLRRTFDYLASTINYQIGQRVNIPFGSRDVIGVIVGMSDQSEFPKNKLKSAGDVVDDDPLLDEKLLKLYHWASDYYQHPIGDVILGTLPKKIRDGKNDNVSDLVNNTVNEAPLFELTDEQKQAIQIISNTKTFQPFLLSGVTGSGKTEVYLRVIENILKNNQQALVLVPEISLTPQTVARFQARFSVPVLLLHSGLTDKKRYESWMQATKDKPCIVIGTRSAVFAPLKNCGVIVIDEEHDISFKQQAGFRYHARDVAVMRAKINDIPIILGTATPSLETLHNVNQKKYQLLVLSERAGNAKLPSIQLHNICNEKLHQGLSPVLIAAIRKHLNNNNQVLLFLNRRGYAPVLLCHHCGFSAVCPYCDARLTAHDSPKRLLCHHCGYQSAFIRVCTACKQSEMMMLGLGTEQLQETLHTLFPSKIICRVDRDNVKSFSELEKTLTKVHNKAVDILIGTQMLVKGHHFESVTLVAAIDVDNALFSSDFRAIERLGQSLIQVAGRAGRSEKIGEVFIQSHHPEHPLLQTLFQNGYEKFAQAVLSERQLTQLPPFVSIALLRAESKNKKQAYDFLLRAKNIFAETELLNSVEIFGPFPSLLEKKGGVFRFQLFIQSVSRSILKKAVVLFLSRIEKEKKIVGLKWILDVDPMEN